jgi:predicted dehydrogenase
MSFHRSNRRTFIRQTAGALAGLSIVPESWEALPVVQGPPVKIGIIGAGRQGRAIIAELQKITQVEIAALCDVSAPRLEAAAGQLKGVATFADHRQLLDAQTGITALVVATPTHLHRQIVEDCLSAGRHVYCEGPIAASVEDCLALQKAAAAAV